VRVHLPLHLPALGQELGPEVYSSTKNDPVRQEPPPINPRNLIAGPRNFCLCLLLDSLTFLRLFPLPLADEIAETFLLPPHIGDIVTGLLLLPPLISDIIVATRVGVVVPMEGTLCGRFELPDPSDPSGDLHGSVDLVPDMAGGFVDEGCSKGRISSESECAAAH